MIKAIIYSFKSIDDYLKAVSIAKINGYQWNEHTNGDLYNSAINIAGLKKLYFTTTDKLIWNIYNYSACSTLEDFLEINEKLYKTEYIIINTILLFEQYISGHLPTLLYNTSKELVYENNKNKLKVIIVLSTNKDIIQKAQTIAFKNNYNWYNSDLNEQRYDESDYGLYFDIPTKKLYELGGLGGWDTPEEYLKNDEGLEPNDYIITTHTNDLDSFIKYGTSLTPTNLYNKTKELIYENYIYTFKTFKDRKWML